MARGRRGGRRRTVRHQRRGPVRDREEKVTVLEALRRRRPGIDVVPVLTEGNLPDTLWLLERVNDLPAGWVSWCCRRTTSGRCRPTGSARSTSGWSRSPRHPVLVYHIPTLLGAGAGRPGRLDAGVGRQELRADDPEWSATLRAAGKQVMVGTEIGPRPRPASTATAPSRLWPTSSLARWSRCTGSSRRREREAGPARRPPTRGLGADQGARLPRHPEGLAQAQSGIPMGTVRPPLLPPPAVVRRRRRPRPPRPPPLRCAVLTPAPRRGAWSCAPDRRGAWSCARKARDPATPGGRPARDRQERVKRLGRGDRRRESNRKKRAVVSRRRATRRRSARAVPGRTADKPS